MILFFAKLINWLIHFVANLMIIMYKLRQILFSENLIFRFLS